MNLLKLFFECVFWVNGQRMYNSQDFLILWRQEIPLHVPLPARILCLLPNVYLIVSSSSQPNKEDPHFPIFRVSSLAFSWIPVANFQAILLQISFNNLSSSGL